jgi:hypothetical protein
VFPFADVFDFLAHKFRGLRTRSLSLASILPGSFDRFPPAFALPLETGGGGGLVQRTRYFVEYLPFSLQPILQVGAV